MHIKLVIMIALFLSISAGMHVAFFSSIIHFFKITRPFLKILLYTAMVILAVSFILSFILLRFNENAWSIGYYQISALWLGFLIHFLVGVAATWLLILVGRLTGVFVNQRLTALLFLAASAGWITFGIWNAFNPTVTEIRVPINYLSENWRNKTLVQISDVHLGHFHGKKFIERLVKKANQLNPDLIVITGDLFDGMGGRCETLIEVLNRLEAKHGIYFITGNHEYYVGISKAMALLKQTRIQILANEMIDINGLQLIGISYPGIRGVDEIANFNADDPAKRTRILLFHTPTNIQVTTGDSSHRHYNTYWKPDLSFHLAKRLNIDLQLSGHTHHGQIFPFNLLSGFLFKEYDYGLKKNGNFSIWTSCGAGTWGPPLRTAGRSEIVRILLEPSGP